MTLAALALLGLAFFTIGPLPYKAPPKLHDVAQPVALDQVRLNGYLGHRVDLNASVRLKSVDLEPLLAGFRSRPGSHPWIGEHIGKWMHAATLAWVYKHDPELKKKLDYAASELIKCQEPDGYLGTYSADKRFGLYPEADWDVWSHKYCLIGLLTYYRYTGSDKALTACRKIGDLLIRTFGRGKKSILSAGTHMGMAATSVLEPVVLLYRQTGELKYLDFAKYIVDAWDEPGGPKILASLASGGHVGKTANGKAYEMLSNLVGLCELARATGDNRFLQAAENGWSDIVADQLYLTGSASYYEHFHEAQDLPSAMAKNVGETCVTVTWIQLSEQLLRLTGEAKYGDELERSFYNHLAAAQRPDGGAWCYYTSLEGTKPYTQETCCCLSSGPRAMAMAPEMACLLVHKGGKDYIAVNTFDPFEAKVNVRGETVEVAQETAPLFGGRATVQLVVPHGLKIGLMVREPSWVGAMVTDPVAKLQNGWGVIEPREWDKFHGVQINYQTKSAIVLGGPSQTGRAALTYGPFVLAWPDGDNTDTGSSLRTSLLDQATRTESDLKFQAEVEVAGKRTSAVFVPFAEAGADGTPFRVWLGAPGTPDPFANSVFYGAQESRSSNGNVDGSITDGDPDSFVVTFDSSLQKLAWFSLSARDPVEVKRVVFCHGRSFHDGGWFDTSSEKPRIEIQLTPGGEWILVGHLDDYPVTTAKEASGLRDGQAFALTLANSVKCTAIRVVGQPAGGDNPAQSFASCAELQAYSK